MFKTANVGTVDRFLRLVIGALLVAAPWIFQTQMWESAAMRWGAPAVGAILIVTALVRFCPLYRLAGIKTCRVK